jgi:hypothetical protein
MATALSHNVYRTGSLYILGYYILKISLTSYELWSTNSAVLFLTAHFARRPVRIQPGAKTVPTEPSRFFSVPPVTCRNRIFVHCFTVHFNSLNLTYQLMHFYIQ